MKSMKTILSSVFMLSLLFISLQSMAQCRGGGDHANRGAKMLEMMTTELDLSQEQVKQLEALNSDLETKMKALWSSDTENKEANRESRRELHTAHKKAVAAILTADQLAKFKELRAEHRGGKKGFHHRGGKKGPHHAKGGPWHLLSKEDRTALKQELKNYKETNVTPAIRAERLKLDKQIKNADKRKIAKHRIAMNELHTSGKALKTQAKEARKSGQEVSAEFKSQMEALHTQKKALMEDVKALVENYDEAINTHMEVIAAKKAAWGDAMKAISKPYFDKVDVENAEGRDRGDWNGHHGRKGGDKSQCEGKERSGDKSQCEGKERGGDKAQCEGKGRGGNWKGHHGRKGGKVKFLLMDPKANNLSDEDMFESPEQREADILVFPNPSSQTSNTIQYEVREAGNVKIDLLSRDGKLVKTVLNEYKEAGTYSTNVNLSELRGEIYLYRVTDSKGATTEKFLVQ